MENEKLAAAFKIGKGVYCACAGVLTACGMGIVGGFLRSHHLMGEAQRVAQIEFREAEESIKEGLSEWRNAS